MLTMIDPNSDEWEDILTEASAQYNRHMHSGGARGQLITPYDSYEYWVCKVFVEHTNKKQEENMIE